MNSEAVTALETAYAHVDDIDLFPGIMSESPTRGDPEFLLVAFLK